MKKLLFCIITGLISLIGFSQPQAFISEKVEKLWETSGFETPECVCYDAMNKVYYVSNVAGVPLEKDGNGFISVLSTDGKIKTLKWITGLDAPKGMVISEGSLFVTDIDRIVQIDIKSAKIIKTVPVEGALFLNDMAADPEGNIYITDSQTKKYLMYNGKKVETLLSDTAFGFPNGIIYEDKMLLSGTGSNVIKINPATAAYEAFIEKTGGIDGLQKVIKNTFLISDWSGKMHLIYTNKEKELIIDTTPIENMNAADFYLYGEENLILIPTFFGNSVACYRLKL